jgi:hypothetical protein
VVVANSGAVSQQPNNCSNEISNLISINNAVIINPNQNQDVNNNEHATRIHRNNGNSNNDRDEDLGEIEPTFFENDEEDLFKII